MQGHTHKVCWDEGENLDEGGVDNWKRETDGTRSGHRWEVKIVATHPVPSSWFTIRIFTRHVAYFGPRCCCPAHTTIGRLCYRPHLLLLFDLVLFLPTTCYVPKRWARVGSLLNRTDTLHLLFAVRERETHLNTVTLYLACTVPYLYSIRVPTKERSDP